MSDLGEGLPGFEKDLSETPGDDLRFEWIDEHLKRKLRAIDLEKFLRESSMRKADPDHERVMGYASEEVLRMYALWRITERQCKELGIALEYGNDELREKNISKFVELKEYASFYERTFWIMVRSLYDLWGRGTAGIRDEGKIILQKEDASSALSGIGVDISGLPPELKEAFAMLLKRFGFEI